VPRFSARPPAVATLLIDDDHSRATRWDFEPGAATGWHRHGLAYVVVPLTDCQFLIETDAGDSTAFIPAGAAYTREAGAEHNVVNGGDAPMAFVEIELKR
jgi:quercetin dioxygenase-like cupin family protein